MSETLTGAALSERRAQFPILENSTYLVSHSMGAAPLGAREALDAYWDEWAADGPEAWERWLPRIAEIADGIGAIVGAHAGTVFLGPNVSVLQAAIATCIDFRGERNEVVYESLQFPSLTYVWREWERYGAAVADRRLRRRPHDPDRAHLRSDHREDRDRRDLARLLRLGRARRRSRDSGALPPRRALCSASTPIKRPASYPYDVTELDLDLVTGGSHKWLCGGPGLRLDLREAVAARTISPGDDRLDGARAPVRVRSRADRPRAVDVPLRPRHADDSGLRRRRAGARHDSRRSASRAFASTTSA